MLRSRWATLTQWDDYFMALAFLSAMRSKDPNRQVGAVIVNPDRIILGTPPCAPSLPAPPTTCVPLAARTKSSSLPLWVGPQPRGSLAVGAAQLTLCN